MSSNGTATAQAKILEGDFRDESIPKPVGKLYDPSGHTVRPPVRNGLMARIDDKGSKEITLRQSTLWFLATGLVLLGVIFNYGSSAIGWVRDDESSKVQRGVMQKDILEIRSDVGDLNSKLDAIQKQLTEQAIQKAKVEGYTLGQTDAGASGHKK